MNLSKPLENESMGQYIARLLDSKEISTSQIPMAVKHYNSK